MQRQPREGVNEVADSDDAGRWNRRTSSGPSASKTPSPVSLALPLPLSLRARVRLLGSSFHTATDPSLPATHTVSPPLSAYLAVCGFLLLEEGAALPSGESDVLTSGVAISAALDRPAAAGEGDDAAAAVAGLRCWCFMTS